jgi:hypothetical protein
VTLDTTAADRGTGRFRPVRRRGAGTLAVTAAVLACVLAAGCGSGRPAQGLPAEHRAPAARLPGYLAADQDTRIFMVTGPLTGVTALQEMYHP